MDKYLIEGHNNDLLAQHKRKYDFIAADIPLIKTVIQQLIDFQVAIPSWALGTGGTRFGRFSGGGEPRNLEEKIEDVGLLHSLNQSGALFPCIFPGMYRKMHKPSKHWLHSIAFVSMP
ncbi:hypothetical protein [Paraflavitalea speifideaquila]|uniref:hypothetical protein n=1 Tax=Paraflavitalea speifideaquila TaxID=3076558 RepID=UPI0028E1C785|nr:hypothetical protein [Paraflavitalea speifideiaquila]